MTTQEAVFHKTRFTTADLDLFPDDGTRYEIIDGELIMSKQPHWLHQRACGQAFSLLNTWSNMRGTGQASITPGVLFTDNDNVVPDVVWISNKRLAMMLNEAGHLTGAPELAIEVLSLGGTNERRDREAKRKLYGSRGVQEYWILDWRLRQVEIYRHDEGELQIVGTLFANDELTSPLLPGFMCRIEQFFV